jgi:hypothetical protein
MTYERMTAAPIREVLRLAEEVLTSRLPTRRWAATIIRSASRVVTASLR